MSPRRELKDMEELVEEILKRLPPDEPEHLVRASLVCKTWYRLLSGDGFRRRYRAFHRIPPMLGLLCNSHNLIATFVPTSKFSPRDPEESRSCLLECRHGRVLHGFRSCLAVWDPMTGSQTRLGALPNTEENRSRRTTVLCGAAGCDHRACQSGPFIAVLITFEGDPAVARAFVYSSETGRWSAPASLPVGDESFLENKPSVLVGEALYFLTFNVAGFYYLKYDLGDSCLSKIDLPREAADNDLSPPVLLAAEDGELGLVAMENSSFVLYELSRENGVAAWTQPRVLADLKTLIRAIGDDMVSPPLLVGSVEGTDIVFVTTEVGTYKVHLKSSTKPYLCTRSRPNAIFPYMSFCNSPGAVATGNSRSNGSGRGNEETSTSSTQLQS